MADPSDPPWLPEMDTSSECGVLALDAGGAYPRSVSFETEYSGERILFGTSGNLLVSVWRDAPDLPSMVLVRESAESMALRWPQGFAYINVVASGKPRFSEAVRRETREFMRSITPLATAHVLLLPGFLKVAVSSFINTALLLARPSAPTRIFSDLDAGLDFVEPLLAAGGQSWTREQLRAAVDSAVSLAEA